MSPSRPPSSPAVSPPAEPTRRIALAPGAMGSTAEQDEDVVAVEEPLAIRVEGNHVAEPKCEVVAVSGRHGPPRWVRA